MRDIIAVDPGVTGAIAVSSEEPFGDFEWVWTERLKANVCVFKMPDTQGAIVELFKRLSVHRWRAAFLELVTGYIGQGHPGSAMFTFGENYGFLKGIMMTLGISLELVRPQVWQKALGIGARRNCSSRHEWKRKLAEEACRRYPTLSPGIATADAVLILDWAFFHKNEITTV